MPMSHFRNVLVVGTLSISLCYYRMPPQNSPLTHPFSHRLFQYCSNKCQSDHWKDPKDSHKQVCADMDELRQIYESTNVPFSPAEHQPRLRKAFQDGAVDAGFTEDRIAALVDILKTGHVLSMYPTGQKEVEDKGGTLPMESLDWLEQGPQPLTL